MTHPDQPEGIADDSHDLPTLEGATKRVRAYLEAFGDGVVDATPTGAWWTGGEVRPLYARDLETLARHAEAAPPRDTMSQ